MTGDRVLVLAVLVLQVWGNIDSPDFARLRGSRNVQSTSPPVKYEQPVVSNECTIDAAPIWSIREGVVRVVLDLQEAQPCVNRLVGPARHAKQTVTALAQYFDSFYAFARIAADPTADNYSFAPEFAEAGLGIFGGEGGGAPAELSKVDLIGGLHGLAASIPESDEEFSVAQWIGPVNDLFNSLRDMHVSWDQRTVAPLQLLNEAFILALISDEGFGVKLVVNSPLDAIVPNGAATPIFEDAEGNVVNSIDGDLPMHWLLKNMVEVPTFPGLGYKSIGARMNVLLNIVRGGIAFGLGQLGTLSALSPEPISVNLTNKSDGSLLEASWQWKVVALQSKENQTCNFTCIIDSAKAQISSQSSGNAKSITDANVLLSMNWQSEAARSLSRASHAKSWESGPARLLSESSPVSNASSQSNASVNVSTADNLPIPEGLFAWLLEPTSATDTYGYFAFRTGDDGTEYGVFKYTTFVLDKSYGMAAPAGWNLVSDDTAVERTYALLQERWEAFAREAKSRGTSRLVVDMVGNSGGLTSLAWQFVQFMHPDLPFSATCGSANRPVPAIFEKWNSINLVPLFEFATYEGLQQQRIDELQGDPVVLKALLSNLHSLTEVTKELQLFTQDEVDNVTAAAANNGLWSALTLLTNLIKADVGNNPFADSGGLPLLESYKHVESQSRGGKARNFTARFRECPATPPRNLTNPFTDIIFVSDGQCGSSCYLASGTSWALAKKYGSRKVRFATFGGIGGSLREARQTLSPTSFPGGNVQADGATAVFKPVAKSVIVQLAVAQIMGDSRLTADLREVWADMVDMTPWYSTQLPQFTQSEAYQLVFGPKSPPAEYVFVPTDIYIPAWLSGLSGANPSSWNMDQLDIMYGAAAKAFTE